MPRRTRGSDERSASLPARPTGGRRVGALAVAAWLLGVAVTGVVASRAVAVLDTETSRSGVLSRAEVDRALVAARAAVSAGPVTAPTPRPSGSAPAVTTAPAPAPTGQTSSGPLPPPPPVTAAPPQPPAAVARTWNVPGGTVAASCTGAAISLLYATPVDGWTVEVGATGPDHLEVELRQSGAETKVTAVCVAGVPQQSTTEGSPDGGGEGSSADG